MYITPKKKPLILPLPFPSKLPGHVRLCSDECRNCGAPLSVPTPDAPRPEPPIKSRPPAQPRISPNWAGEPCAST